MYSSEAALPRIWLPADLDEMRGLISTVLVTLVSPVSFLMCEMVTDKPVRFLVRLDGSVHAKSMEWHLARLKKAIDARCSY